MRILPGAVFVMAAAAMLGHGCGGRPPAIGQSRTGPVVEGDLGRRIDAHLSARVASGFNGSALVAVDGGIILDKGYGWADREHRVPVTTATPFWIASISKQFAAAALLTLADRGRLSVQDTIGRFIPAAPPDKQGMTLHQLLTHTAGLEQRYAADGIADRDAAVRAILGAPLARPPGQAFGYSNDAYNLVAAIVEIAAGVPFEQYVRERLLDPAGLAHTGFWGPPDHPDAAAILGGDLDGQAILQPNWGFRGGTGMFSTPGDLFRWYQAVASGRVLSDESRTRLFTAHVMRGETGVAYGWFTSASPTGTPSHWTRGFESFGHSAVLAVYPDDHVVIAVASNSGEREPRKPESHELERELAGMVLASR